MARNLTAALKAEFLKLRLSPVVFVEIEFLNSTARLWSGYGNLSWNGQTWLGMGTVGSVSSISESSDIAANGISLSLSGIPTDTLDDCLNEIRSNKRVKLWFGAVDANGGIIVDPYLSFQGFTDVPTIEEGADSCTITLTCEPRWIDRRARKWAFTQEDQNVLHPGDTGFRFLKDINKPLYWGKAAVGTNGNNTIRDIKGYGEPGGGPERYPNSQ
jgi:hypothetical protein